MYAQATSIHEISHHPSSVLCRQSRTYGPFGMVATPMRFARNSEIYGEDEAAEHLYQVVSGAVRTYKIMEDGRRQIGAFYLPGDIFGFEAGDSHIASAETVCETHLLMVKRSALIVRASQDCELTRQLWDAMALELRRFQEHLMLLISYEERCDRAADVTAGCCRLSWLDDRNGLAHPHSTRAEWRDCLADLAPNRVT
jgi:CRP/FNR family nitrogen fixation transcriptional regulator